MQNLAIQIMNFIEEFFANFYCFFVGRFCYLNLFSNFAE